MSFYISTYNGVSDDINFVLQTDGSFGEYIAAYADTKAYSNGWDAQNHCPYCIYKRMTSIGQSTENLSDGASFGPVTWSNAAIDCSGGAGCDETPNLSGMFVNSNWISPILAGCMEWPQWEATGQNPGLGDCHSQSNTAVQVSWTDTADEIDFISLSNPPKILSITPTPTPAPTPTPEPTPLPCKRQPCPLAPTGS
jgi:hypothetical protein